MFWKRKPVTHAIALWILVGLAAAGLIAVLGYLSLLSRLQQGSAPAAAPPRAAAPATLGQQPSLFGTVVSVDGRSLTIDSKQAFTRVTFDGATSLTSVGGQAFAPSDFTPGTVITATGKDKGGGEMAATAIVVLQKH